MDEFHSPYCYVGNHSVNFIDPDGSQSGPQIRVLLDPKTGLGLFVFNEVEITLDSWWESFGPQAIDASNNGNQVPYRENLYV